ncbi:adenylate kinase [Nocardioides sp.]|uniref:adenylate kinase n=1 Tax=Nocardioides sp. TaxID=35761 RepID=UPI002C5F4C2D|nr:adenylate kinase [Nocardioides sp.]HXH78322.1 adenylate kinase [Nocardioides sp.]
MATATWREVSQARRILLHGVTGSGKSTLALALGAALDLPVTLVDEEMWRPGWVPVPLEEQDDMSARWIARDEWILDSAYGRHRAATVERADVVICLDYPRLLSLGRLVRRTATRIVTQEQLCNGNTETLRNAVSRDSIVRWHFTSWRRKRDTMRAWHADPVGPRVLLLTRPRDADDLLRRLGC